MSNAKTMSNQHPPAYTVEILPSIILAVKHGRNNSEKMKMSLLAIFTSRWPEECSNEKLNHFKPAGHGRSLNVQHNANATTICSMVHVLS